MYICFFFSISLAPKKKTGLKTITENPKANQAPSYPIHSRQEENVVKLGQFKCCCIPSLALGEVCIDNISIRFAVS